MGQFRWPLTSKLENALIRSVWEQLEKEVAAYQQQLQNPILKPSFSFLANFRGITKKETARHFFRDQQDKRQDMTLADLASLPLILFDTLKSVFHLQLNTKQALPDDLDAFDQEILETIRPENEPILRKKQSGKSPGRRPSGSLSNLINGMQIAIAVHALTSLPKKFVSLTEENADTKGHNAFSIVSEATDRTNLSMGSSTVRTHWRSYKYLFGK